MQSGGTWQDLQASPAELRPELTLTTGQCFNWTLRSSPADDASDGPVWVGVLGLLIAL